MQQRLLQIGVVLAFALAFVLAVARVSAMDNLGQIHTSPSQPALSTPHLSSSGALPYHNGASLVCSDCHSMHASAQHDFAGTDGDMYNGQANRKLLKASDNLHLCLSCHDGQAGVPDVLGADTNGLTQRSAGFFADPDTQNYRGHALGSNLPGAPSDHLVGDSNELCNRCHFAGSYATAKVTCTDCHNPHGNGKARNLQWASWPGYEPNFGLLEKPSATGMARYERANVAYGTQDSNTLREISNMCLDCHHVFSGGYYIDRDGNGIHERHPTYDSERNSMNRISQGQSRGSSDPAHWMAGAGSGFDGTNRVPFLVKGATTFDSATVLNADTNGVFCLSCHKAHGGDHAFSLTWPTDGGSGPRGCDQCHGLAG